MENAGGMMFFFIFFFFFAHFRVSRNGLASPQGEYIMYSDNIKREKNKNGKKERKNNPVRKFQKRRLVRTRVMKTREAFVPFFLFLLLFSFYRFTCTRVLPTWRYAVGAAGVRDTKARGVARRGRREGQGGGVGCQRR